MHYDEGMTDAMNLPLPPSGEPAAGSFPTLASLGIEQAILMDAVRVGVVRAKDVTVFHPTTARGFVQWSETVASLRQDLDKQGWSLSDPKNSPRVTSPDGKTSIMVIGGNEATGVSLGVDPRTARRRGPSTQHAVESNDVATGRGLRGGIQGVLDIVLQIQRTRTEPQNWVLLYHWSSKDPVVRAELSLPTAIQDGEITAWGPRILLPAQGMEEFDFDIMPQPVSPQDEVDFKIVELA